MYMSNSFIYKLIIQEDFDGQPEIIGNYTFWLTAWWSANHAPVETIFFRESNDCILTQCCWYFTHFILR